MAKSTAGLKDVYPNIIAGNLTMSAANTITFSEINVGLNIFDKVALLIQRLEVQPAQGTLADLDTDTDEVFFGISASNNITALNPILTEVIDMFGLHTDLLGAVVSKMYVHLPLAHDFSTLGGGGVLVSPRPLYAVGASLGMTVAGVFDWRMYFNIIRLSDAEYLELLETRRAFG